MWYRRRGGRPWLVRWSRQRGSVHLADQKLPITYTRVRDLPANREVPLGTYQRLHEPRQADRRVLLKVLRGLSCLACAECAEAVAAGLGIALLSRHALRMELALRRLVVLDVKGLPLRRQWYVVHRQDKRLSRAAVAFKAFLLTSAEAVLASPKQPWRSNRRTRG